MTRIVLYVRVEVINGQSLNRKPRSDRDNMLVVYAATKTTIAIFHLGGGITGFELGSMNHVSRPVAVS